MRSYKLQLLRWGTPLLPLIHATYRVTKFRLRLRELSKSKLRQFGDLEFDFLNGLFEWTPLLCTAECSRLKTCVSQWPMMVALVGEWMVGIGMGANCKAGFRCAPFPACLFPMLSVDLMSFA